MNEQNKKKNTNTTPAKHSKKTNPAIKFSSPDRQTASQSNLDSGYKAVNARENISKALKSKEIRDALASLVNTINYTHGKPNNAALVIYQPIVTKMLNIFFDNFHTKYKEVSGDDYGNLIEFWSILCKLVENSTRLTQKDKENFKNNADPWTRQINALANSHKHDFGKKFDYDYQSHIVIPYNVLMQTLDDLLNEKNLFSSCTLKGDPVNRVWFGNIPPINDYEIKTSEDDTESALIVRFLIDTKSSDFQDRIINKNSKGISMTQRVLHIKYRLDIRHFEYRYVEQTPLTAEIVGVYYRADNDNPKNDILMAPYTGAGSMHDPKNNIWEVRMEQKFPEQKDKYYVRIKVTYKDKRIKGWNKKVQRDFGVAWSGKRIDDIK